MRLFIGILILIPHLAFGANKCPDFSGKYTLHGEDGRVDITITQSACQRITIARKSNYLGRITNEKHIIRLDGNFQDDSSWYGGLDRERSSARFVAANMELVVKAASSDKIFWKVLYELLPDGNLLIKDFDNRTKSYSSGILAERQK